MVFGPFSSWKFLMVQLEEISTSILVLKQRLIMNSMQDMEDYLLLVVGITSMQTAQAAAMGPCFSSFMIRVRRQ